MTTTAGQDAATIAYVRQRTHLPTSVFEAELAQIRADGGDAIDTLTAAMDAIEQAKRVERGAA